MSHTPRSAANNSVRPHVAITGDFSVMSDWHRWDVADCPFPVEEGALWTFSRPAGGLNPGDVSAASGMWQQRPPDGGSGARKRLAGQTKDSTGTALGGVTVQLLTSDGSALADTRTSDASGYYELFEANPTGGGYKVDAYLAGSPDVAGTTVNNIVPT